MTGQSEDQKLVRTLTAIFKVFQTDIFEFVTFNPNLLGRSKFKMYVLIEED